MLICARCWPTGRCCPNSGCDFVGFSSVCELYPDDSKKLCFGADKSVCEMCGDQS